MTDKLEKLTKQIYDEGVGKAQQEAEKIIQAANDEKKKILRAARQEAEDITNLAKKEADELKNRVESEMRMAAGQSLALLRQKITELISVKVASSSVKGIFDDKDFLKKILEVVMKEWVGSGCQRGQDFYLKLSKNVQKDIQEHFLKKGKQELNKGLEIEFDEKIKSGFVISPKDESFRIGFTEEDFKALIQYFLRPRMRDFLFKSEKSESPE
ncbi:MAG: V-type ATP synthase subunit E [Candidatus Omnitrophota bacterium]